MNFYNEIDSYAAQWLRRLIAAGRIPAGVVDERSIEDITPDELRPYTQCHFFAGIAGWSHALALAGWSSSRPVWTGSCPCQPFSAAGKRKRGLQTSEIYGPPGSISSRSADLQSSLASRLRQRLGTAGLIEQSVTWKEMATPLGALYCKRAAQTRSISATGCGSLPTPSGTSNHGKNHVAGRLDEWGGSSNPFRRGKIWEAIGSVHSPAFELWMMGYPETWRQQMPPVMPSSRRLARSS